MADELPPLNSAMIGRHFANAIMHWKVSNISLALCTPSMMIHSPEFTLSGPVPTRWKMSLDISSQDDRLLLFLEMLPSKVKNLRVKVNWIAYVMDPKGGEVSVVVERAHTFEPNGRATVDVFELWNVIKKLPDASPDDLKIRCSMLVQFGYNPPFPQSQTSGIIALSYDLGRLTKENVHSDVTIRLKDAQFPLHRAILCNRSSHLNTLIQPFLEKQTITLGFSDRNALECLFFYLYTGDLSYVLSNPSIMICDYIERLGIPELKGVYPLERLKLESKIEAEEHVFGWTILDCRNLRTPLSSMELTEEGMESRWRLHFYPRGPPGAANEQHKKFLYLEAELLHSARPVDVCLEFATVTDQNEVIHTRRIHGSMNVRDRMGLEFFRLGGTNMEKSLQGDALFLRFIVRIATGENTPLLRESHPPNPLQLRNDRTYLIFSQMMGVLLASQDYVDAILMVEGDCFKAHKFLLAARSPVFKRLVETSPRDKFGGVAITIPNVRKHAFRVFLEFLYTGLINDTESGVLMQLYDISGTFAVASLRRLCTQFLVGDVNPENVLQFLLWANERKETEVKTRCLHIIAAMSDGIRDHPFWEILAVSNPEMCDDILEFLNYNDLGDGKNLQAEAGSSRR